MKVIPNIKNSVSYIKFTNIKDGTSFIENNPIIKSNAIIKVSSISIGIGTFIVSIEIDSNIITYSNPIRIFTHKKELLSDKAS